MILLFLGSWRCTLIVVISIPLSILVSIIVLRVLGQTLNVMTLGGLALAVGILVDDATVEIENIHRNIGQRKPFVRAIIDGAQQIAVPAFVSTLCICIVFVPVAFITGAAKSLFVPLALAVVFAMLTSYLLSRTLVPTMVRYLLAREALARPRAEPVHRARSTAAFERLRTGYGRWLAWALAAPRVRRRSRSSLFVAGSLALRAAARARLLPERRRRPDQAARARRAGHAHRGDREAHRRRSSARSAASSRSARSRRCSTTSARRTRASTCRSARAR